MGSAMADNDMTMMSEHHQEEDFSGRRVSWWAVADSTFERCKFESLRVKGAELGGGTTPSIFIDCSFDGSRFNEANLGYLRFERCTFRNVMLKRWIWVGLEEFPDSLLPVPRLLAGCRLLDFPVP